MYNNKSTKYRCKISSHLEVQKIKQNAPKLSDTEFVNGSGYFLWKRSDFIAYFITLHNTMTLAKSSASYVISQNMHL